MADQTQSCSSCGALSTSGASRFCRNCGAELQPSVESAARPSRRGLFALVVAMVVVIGGGSFAAIQLRGNEGDPTPLRDTPAAQDHAAQRSVLNAVLAMHSVFSETHSQVAVTAAAIEEIEEIEVVDGATPSNGPTEVSMSTHGPGQFVFAARSASGKCFAIKDSVGFGYIDPGPSGSTIWSGRCAGDDIPVYEFSSSPSAWGS